MYGKLRELVSSKTIAGSNRWLSQACSEQDSSKPALHCVLIMTAQC